jgi:putative ABC transport system permease protein
MLSDWMIRLRSLLERADVERELDEELRAHIERQTEAYERAGLTHAEALRRAQVEFGGLDQVKEACRDARGIRWIEEAGRDLRFAARLLARDRWFTGAVVGVLALGIGVNATVFALVNAVLIRDLPFERADEVVSLGTRDTRRTAVYGPLGYGGISYQEYQEWRRSASTFAGIAAYAGATMNVSDDIRAPERFSGAYVSGHAFGVLGRQPQLGRDFRPEDDRPGAQPVVILGARLWANRYGADPAIVGQTIRVNATPAVVVGVMPARFGFPLTAEIWQPLAQMPGLLHQPRAARVLNGVGRLADGTSIARARSDLDAIADRVATQFPDTDANIRSTVWPYADRHIAPQVKLIVAALMGAVIFVLLIACANVANLLLARAAARSREVSVRAALGATRWRIVRQLLFESLLLAALAGAAGYGLSLVGVRLLWSVLGAHNPPYWLQLTMDLRALGFLMALCLGTAVLFGLAPALQISRTGDVDGLRHAPRTVTPARAARRWASALLIAEIALTLVLLGGAGFMMRSFLQMYRAHGNVETSGLLTLRVDLPSSKYRKPEQRIAFVEQLEERLGHLDAVAAGAIASSIPFEFPLSRALAVEGRAPMPTARPPRVSVVAVSDRFLATLNLHLVRGRDFTSLDGMPGRERAIVNQRFAALYFPEGDPIGRRIRLTNPTTGDTDSAPWVTVIGICPTIRRDVTTAADPAVSGDPVVYLPYRAQPVAGLAVLVRTTRNADTVVPEMREAARALDPDLPFFDVQTVDEWLAFLRWPERVFGTMFTIFACIGLITAALGLYAVTAYSVRQRTQEIGVRLALGARAPRVWWLVLRRVLAQIAIGLAVGLPGAFIVGRLPWMGSANPGILLLVAMVVIVVAGVAAFLPARRATRMDPLIALRYE